MKCMTQKLLKSVYTTATFPPFSAVLPGLQIGEDETLLKADRRQQVCKDFHFLLKHYMGHRMVRYTGTVLTDT